MHIQEKCSEVCFLKNHILKGYTLTFSWEMWALVSQITITVLYWVYLHYIIANKRTILYPFAMIFYPWTSKDFCVIRFLVSTVTMYIGVLILYVFLWRFAYICHYSSIVVTVPSYVIMKKTTIMYYQGTQTQKDTQDHWTLPGQNLLSLAAVGWDVLKSWYIQTSEIFCTLHAIIGNFNLHYVVILCRILK